MPTYQYRCRDCGRDLEIVQSFSDEALTTCPECEGSLRKVFSSVGISFKGSGFYKTDSRPGSGSSSANREASSSASAATSSGSDSSTPAPAGPAPAEKPASSKAPAAAAAP